MLLFVNAILVRGCRRRAIFETRGGDATSCGTLRHCDIFNLCMGRRTNHRKKDTNLNVHRFLRVVYQKKKKKEIETFCTSLLPPRPHVFLKLFLHDIACLKSFVSYIVMCTSSQMAYKYQNTHQNIF